MKKDDIEKAALALAQAELPAPQAREFAQEAKTFALQVDKGRMNVRLGEFYAEFPTPTMDTEETRRMVGSLLLGGFIALLLARK